MLDTLGLSAVAESRVGSTERRGVSGGERKRTALGAELVLVPALLLADEPTSGLDARAALEVATLLKTVDATVCCSVHQPGARVMKQFTDLVVLGRAGALLYAGPAATAAKRCAQIAAAPVPPLTSAAEYLLDLADDADAVSRLTAAAAAASTPPVRADYDDDGTVPLSRRSRFRPLLRRAWLNNARAPAATVAAVGRSATMAALVGALYAGSRGAADQGAVADRTGALFFVLVNQAFSAMAPRPRGRASTRRARLSWPRASSPDLGRGP